MSKRNVSKSLDSIQIAFESFKRIIKIEDREILFKSGAVSLYLFLLDYVDTDISVEELIKKWS